MRGWETIKLDDVAAINYGYTESAKYDPIGPHFLRITDLQDGEVDWGAVPFCIISDGDKPKYKLASGDIVFARTGATTGKSYLIDDPPDAVFASYLIRLRLKSSKLLPQFVRYFFQTSTYWDIILKGTSGSAQGGFNASKLGAMEIAFPPLSEQRRIVAVLDEAFEGLATATANTEKNLKNAREVFDSYLNSVFIRHHSTSKSAWKSVSLSEVAATAYGYTDSASFEKVGPRFLRITDLQDGEVGWESVPYCKISELEKEKYKLISGDIVFARTGATTGKSYLIDAPPDSVFASYLIRLRLRTDDLLPQFVRGFFQSAAYWDIVSKGTSGSAQGGFNASKLGAINISFPILSEQRHIVVELDLLAKEVRKLEVLCRQKLAAIAELKQSLLQKAFAGELTKDFRPNVTAFSAASKLSSLSTADFHAGILAMAYDRHLRRDKHKTFGRVKGQKFLHLVESVGRIDLGRAPIKDAAGPNDFQHMLRAEDWAHENDFFEFVQRHSGNGYEFKKLARFDDQLKRANAALEPFRADLNKVIDLIIDMNSEEAELFATVHAAWNNLIIDGKPITDAAIVREARENWHPDKLRISEQSFHNALNSIRTRKLEPDGTAKYVGGQTRLI